MRIPTGPLVIWLISPLILLNLSCQPIAKSSAEDGRDWTSLRDAIVAKLDKGEIDAAQQMIKQGEADHKLSPKNATFLRIELLGRQKPIDVQARTQLLDQFTSGLSSNELLGFGNLYADIADYETAALLFEKAIRLDPDDVSSRLNLGMTYVQLHRFDEAERVADIFLSRPDSALSDFGWYNALRTKAGALHGYGRYAEAMTFYEKALSRQPDLDDFTIQMEYLLSAAWLGDPDRFEGAVRLCDSRGGKGYLQRPFYVDSLRAFVLVRRNQPDAARKIVEKWRENAEANRRIRTYWKRTPDRTAIAENWNQLLNLLPANALQNPD